MENNQSQRMNEMNETKGRGLFYGVIAIATFIIMAVGATFAYFTASTSSMNSAVQTGSTTLELDYISYETAWMKNDLIPVDTKVAEYSFERQSDATISDETSKSNALCVDDDGNSICSVYVFQVINTAKSDQEVSIDVISEKNGFKSLNAMAYELSLPADRTDYDSEENHNGTSDPAFKKYATDITTNAITVRNGDGEPLYNYDDDGELLEESNYNEIYVNRKGVIKTLLKYTDDNTKKPAIERLLITTTNELHEDLQLDVKDRTQRIADTVVIPGESTKTFALVLYILNKNENQTDTDALKTFTGQVVVGSGDGVGVSGKIGLAEDIDNLQSQGGPVQEEPTEPDLEEEGN